MKIQKRFKSESENDLESFLASGKVLVVFKPHNCQSIQNQFKFEHIYSPPDLKISPELVSLKMILKFISPNELLQNQKTDLMDLLAHHGPITNSHSVSLCFCKTCKKIISEYRQSRFKALKSASLYLTQGFFDGNSKKSSRQAMPISKRSVSNYYEGMKENMLTLPTKSGKSQVRLVSASRHKGLQLGQLKNIDEIELVQLGGLLCGKCLAHVESSIHIFGGTFKNHIVTFHEMKEIFYQQDFQDLSLIINNNKSHICLVACMYVFMVDAEL